MKVLVNIHRAEEGGFWAQVPALPGCITEAETKEELFANLREALEGCLLTPRGDYQAEPGGENTEVEL